MIKWECNFNIPDSSVQISACLIRVSKYVNYDNYSMVDIIITDETGEIVAKEYVERIDRIFENEIQIYEFLLTKFDNSIIVIDA